MDFKSFIDTVQNNQALTLLLGGSAVTAVLYYIKSLPGKFYNFFIWRFTSHVLISNDDPIFSVVSDWLSHQEFSLKARHLRCDSGVDSHTETASVRLCPGLGGTYFWYKGKAFLLRRENSSGGQDRFGRPVENITLRTLGSSPAAIHSLIEEVQLWANQSNDSFEVYLYQGYWRKVSRKAKRALDSIVLPKTQKQRIISDVQGFIDSKKWYLDRGIPYRRGLLFWGQPGTGKTSLAMGIAGMFDLRIYAINLGSVKDDQDLVNAITQIPEKSMLLIEDIDAATRDRGTDENESNISLAGLLNAIDGVFSRDGRLLVMTTNYPDKLDKALTRPGRVDLMEEIAPLAAPEILTMSKQFLGDDEGAKFAEQFESTVTASELQRLLIQKKNSL